MAKKDQPKEIDCVQTRYEAALEPDFYGSMMNNMEVSRNLPAGNRPAPWDVLMFYLGALEGRVKKLESDLSKEKRGRNG